MKKVFVIDNYDSFTYNLVHILKELGLKETIKVVRNDQFDIEEAKDFDYMLLSPGPGLPKNSGLMPAFIKKYAFTKNILGVCLGHQAIGESFGCELYNLKTVCHGVVTTTKVIAKDELFCGIPDRFLVCRYHSWGIKAENISEDMCITSLSEKNEIMSIKHKKYNVRGVQFHPESIMTQYGKKLIQNWLNT